MTGENPGREHDLSNGGIVLLDGATGTELERRGAAMDGKAWSATAVLTHSETVREVHRAYIEAGADVITANTFSLARHMLIPAGLEDQFRLMNSRAVALALAAEFVESALEPPAAELRPAPPEDTVPA